MTHATNSSPPAQTPITDYIVTTCENGHKKPYEYDNVNTIAQEIKQGKFSPEDELIIRQWRDGTSQPPHEVLAKLKDLPLCKRAFAMRMEPEKAHQPTRSSGRTEKEEQPAGIRRGRPAALVAVITVAFVSAISVVLLLKDPPKEPQPTPVESPPAVRPLAQSTPPPPAPTTTVKAAAGPLEPQPTPAVSTIVLRDPQDEEKQKRQECQKAFSAALLRGAPGNFVFLAADLRSRGCHCEAVPVLEAATQLGPRYGEGRTARNALPLLKAELRRYSCSGNL